MDIIPACTNDTIEIAINVFSSKGLVDISSIQFLPPILSPVVKMNYMKFKTNLYEIDKSAKIVSDLNRI